MKNIQIKVGEKIVLLEAPNTDELMGKVYHIDFLQAHYKSIVTDYIDALETGNIVFPWTKNITAIQILHWTERGTCSIILPDEALIKE